MGAARRGARRAAGDAGGRPRVELTLYVHGDSPASRRARESAQGLVDASKDAEVVLEVVDLAVDRAAAERDNVIAVPMIVRRAPEPVLRLIGSFSSRDQLAEALGLG